MWLYNTACELNVIWAGREERNECSPSDSDRCSRDMCIGTDQRKQLCTRSRRTGYARECGLSSEVFRASGNHQWGGSSIPAVSCMWGAEIILGSQFLNLRICILRPRTLKCRDLPLRNGNGTEHPITSPECPTMYCTVVLMSERIEPSCQFESCQNSAQVVMRQAYPFIGPMGGESLQ
jgi:hypothetical protein